MSAERPADAVRVSAARCPFCHEEVQRGVEPAVCVACHALHHTECMAEHGACSACGASHPRYAPVERPSAARPARPGPPIHALSLPRLAGRLFGLATSRRGLLSVYACVAVAALVTAMVVRDRLLVLPALVALGVSITAAAGTALVDARRGLGAACVGAAPGLALVLSMLAQEGLWSGPSAGVVGVTLAIFGALLVVWPGEREGR